MEAYNILIIFVVLVIFYLIYANYQKKKLLNSEDVLNKKKRILEFQEKINEARKDYIVYSFENKIKAEYADDYNFFNKNPYSNIKEEKIIEFKNTFVNLSENIKQWNKHYVEKELEENKELFDNIDDKSLDNQQRKAIVVDEENNLILAGAGSGKTLTISGKVKYLVERKSIRSDDILLISFTKKASDEMFQRISQKLKIDVDVKTFHKLGLDIIARHNKKRPDIANDLKSIIDKYFKTKVYDKKDQVTNIITFFGYYLNIPKDLNEFENLGEYHDYYKNVDFETIKSKAESKEYVERNTEELKLNKQTLNGEVVKSLEEVIIANFFYLNGINYVYEYKYPYETGDQYHKQYRPDFYLPDYNIYLEHFGINENGKVPWLTPIEEKKYQQGIIWKRETHRKNNTVLLETYSYYNKNGVLLSKLEQKLKAKGVAFKSVDFEEIFKKIYDKKNDRYFEEFKKLINSFIGLFKSNGFKKEQFDVFKEEAMKIPNKFLKERSLLFFDIVKPIFQDYQTYLEKNQMIDFNDMINLATDTINRGFLPMNYKYIIIDEFQDISMSRFKLIKAIKDKTNAKLMCVGDDWQSIYRFAGSDIELFTQFEEYFGHYELLKIEKTYRNSQELINICGKYVMKNKKQLKKNLLSDKHHSNPLRIFGYDVDIVSSIKRAIDEIVHLYGEDADILFLGRNNFDIEVLDKHKEFQLLKSSTGQVNVKYFNYPKLRMKFLTAHRSKGLEADNVIILNLENKLLGFPNKIADDPILSFVLTDSDNYDYAEERRLFYVALTRTKNSTYLVVPDKRGSVFVEELIKDFSITYEMSKNEVSVKDNPNCPTCLKGHLVLRENSKFKNKFLGCTNYPSCNLTIKNVEILNNQIKCTSCGGYMVKRKGKYGEFYGCTNYPYCNQTVRIE